MTISATNLRFALTVLRGLGSACLAGLMVNVAAAQPAMPPASLPFAFEANRGQVDSPAQFIARGRDSLFLLSPDAAQCVFCKMAGPGTISEQILRMQFVGANNASPISGAQELPGKINYLIGNDPARWRTGVTTFAKVRVEEIYPGVNVTYYGNRERLEYDFTIASGANPGVIEIRFDGADEMTLKSTGELMLKVGGCEILLPAPVIYQIKNGMRKEIAGGYKMLEKHTAAFAVGNYDHNLPLVIDPVLSYSTYFGGNAGDEAWAVAVDSNGFVYVAGQTFSTQFTNWTIPPGAYQVTNHGGTQAGDAFVAKFDNLGTNLIYLTYLGGQNDDAAYGLAVDAAGDAYVAGATDSPDFPTQNALYPAISSFRTPSFGLTADAFVAELDPSGSDLIFSTYLGGDGADAAYGLALDSSANIYVTGFTYSTNFPVTNAFQKYLQCPNSVYWNVNAFVTKIGAGGSPLIYSTFLGGTNFDEGVSIAVDAANCAYVTGFTASTNFPTTNYIRQIIGTNIYDGHWLNQQTNITEFFNYDGFVTKLSASGSNLVYSTLLGGGLNDVPKHIAVDAAGNAYVTGGTLSTNFPNTVTNLPILVNGVTNNNSFIDFTPDVTNAFLTQIIWDGSKAAIGYSAVFGGTNRCIDVGEGVAVDALGNVFVVGTTSSTNFPCFPATNSGSLRVTNSGRNDVFIIAFAPNASGLLYSAYLGGSRQDAGHAIALDPADNAYIVGSTDSTNFPALNARQTVRTGTNDTFLAKILLSDASPMLSIAFSRTNVTLAKPAYLPEYKLESNSNALSDTWSLVPVASPPVFHNGSQIITLPVTNGGSFFRLKRF